MTRSYYRPFRRLGSFIKPDVRVSGLVLFPRGSFISTRSLFLQFARCGSLSHCADLFQRFALVFCGSVYLALSDDGPFMSYGSITT